MRLKGVKLLKASMLFFSIVLCSAPIFGIEPFGSGHPIVIPN
ncbi:hypothetical protein [Bacillus sp. JCM 19041]